MAEQMTEMAVMQQERSCAGTSKTNNLEFEKNGYLKVENLWDAEELYHPVPRERGMINYHGSIDRFSHTPLERQVEGSLARYSHPQYKRIHSGVRKKLEKILGNKLYNTYYYDRFYFAGQSLSKHNDRPSCEISVTVHISSNLPVDWPVWIKTPDTYTDKTKNQILIPGEERSVILNPGDGMIYKGCERPHWRDVMPTPKPRKRDWLLRRKPPEYYYHQIFFHYVLSNGIRSHCADDMSRS